MTKDRIKDLQKTTPWPRVSYRRLSRQYRSHELQVFTPDNAPQLTTTEHDPEHNVAEFLAQIDLIRLLIDKIEELTKEVEILRKKKLEPLPDPKIDQELDDKTADIKKLAYEISTKLKRIEQIQESQTAADKASAQWRIQAAQIFSITRRFRDIMDTYNAESLSHRERCKNIMIRQYEIAGIRKTDEEIEEMIENGSRVSIIIDIEAARQAVRTIEDRHQDILKLEKSVRELHEMFSELARLVATQGEMIDNIEFNIFQTKEFVGQALDQTTQAVQNNQARRKKKIFVIIILLAVLFILIFFFVSYLFIQKKFFLG